MAKDVKLSRSQRMIAKVCDDLKALLLAKNEKYGDSALNPSRIFSKADAVEQIRVRIDDKLSRIRTTGERAADEDTARDLAGYLVLLLVAQEMARHAAEVRAVEPEPEPAAAAAPDDPPCPAHADGRHVRTGGAPCACEPAAPDAVTPPAVGKTRAHRIREGVEGEPGKVA